MKSTRPDPFEPLAIAENWLREGRKIALATVISTWGSAPRPVGSHLVVDSNGNFEGSVSGGCVEAEVISGALDTIETSFGQILEFGVADDIAWRSGLSCGGNIRVFVETLQDLGTLMRLNAARKNRQKCCQIIDIANRRSRFSSDSGGETLTGQSHNHDMTYKVGGLSVAPDGRDLFINIYEAPVRIIIVGAVHIAQMLVPTSMRLGWDCFVIDPRGAFSTSERFPHVDLFSEWPEDALAVLGIDHRTALIALSHNPDIDDLAITEALKAGCFYVGALGSKRTHAKRIERLEKAGVSREVLTRIYGPIGLTIGAKSPEEIGIAILAEIISALRLPSNSDFKRGD